MASAFALMKSGVKHLDTSSGPGIAGFAMDTVSGAAASYGLAYTFARFRERSSLARHAPKIAAAVGKLGAVALNVYMGGGHHWATGLLDSIGQAGLNIEAAGYGFSHGAKAAGYHVSAHRAALPPGNEQLVGLNPAPAGVGLTAAEVAALRQMAS